jgi:hypothetical protein
MGLYVNPPDRSKEQWLAENGEKISLKELKDFSFQKDPEHLPVCLVDNGPFTAAAVIFSNREREAFTNPTDDRPKYYFMVPTAKLKALPGGLWEDVLRWQESGL